MAQIKYTNSCYLSIRKIRDKNPTAIYNFCSTSCLTSTDLSGNLAMRYRKTLFWEFFIALMLMLTSSAYLLGWYFTLKVEQLLDEYISQQLEKCMQPAAGTFRIRVLELLQPGDENSTLYRDVRQQAEHLMTLLGASQVIILDKQARVIVSVPDDYFIGQEYPLVATDPFAWRQVWQGQVVCSAIYYSQNQAFKTGYAPLRNTSGELAYVVSIEIGSSKQQIINRLRRMTIYFCLVGVALAFVASLMWWLSLTKPLRKLTRAMEVASLDIYQGDLHSTRRDELGFLINRFNTMLASLREKEASLKQMHRQELERKKHLALLGEFSAGVAHEIRNPLAAMEGFAGLLLRRLKTDEQRQLLHRLLDEIHILNDIVGQILSYARESPLTLKTTPIFSLIDEVLTHTLAGYSGPTIEIRLLLDPQIPTLFIDATEMKKALVNLTRNAVQAMAESASKVLTIRSHRVDERIAITIADSGEGMSESCRQKMFQPFFTTRNDGTGLGLPITMKIVEHHGGQLRVESRQGEGTQITILLPQNSVDSSYESFE